MAVIELVYNLQERFQSFRVAVRQVCVFEYIPEQLRYTRINIHLGNSLAVHVQ